jgi:hypothetical protein
MRDRIPTLFRLPEVSFIDGKTGKSVGNNEGIGRRRPRISDGVRLCAIVHHTDAEREYAYDKKSHFGRLDTALDAAAVNKWTVIDMKKDWKSTDFYRH